MTASVPTSSTIDSPIDSAATSATYALRRPHQSQFMRLRGLNHHVLSWGSADLVTLERPTLVMLHGWMDVGASFQFVVDALRQERHVVALDWRGFGLTDSSGADTYWFPDYLGDLDALLDVISPAAAVDLLGHSMGGNVAMSYAGVRPERVRRLINLEGFGMPETEPSEAPGRLTTWLNELKSPPQLKTYASAQAVAARLMKTNPRLSAAKAGWLAPHWSRAVSTDGSLAWHILGDAAHKRSNPVLYRKAEILACWERITAPTLWVEGDSTNVSLWWGDRYPRTDFEARLSVVADLQRAVLSDAGHMLHHDRPEGLAAHIERFLQGS